MAVSGNNPFPFPPSAHPQRGLRAPISAEQDPGPRGCSVGTQPIARSPACRGLPVPLSGSRGSSWVCPGRPVSSAGARTKRAWQAVKWLPVGQRCRLPALLLPAPSLPSRRARPQQSCSRWVPTSRCFRQSPAPWLVPHGPPPPSSSTELPCVGTAPGFLSSGCLLLLSPFVLSPPPSSLCRQLGPPPSSASSRNQTPSGPDAVCVAERCGSCSPVRGQSGAWISGNVRTASGSPAPLRCSLIPEQHQVLFTEAPSRA